MQWQTPCLPATLSTVGTYTVNYALAATNEDTNPENNFESQSFEVTEYSYGRDNGVIIDEYGGAFDFVSMPYYDIHNDVTIYGIDVAIMQGGEAGSSIRGFIVNMNDPANLGSDGPLFGTHLRACPGKRNGIEPRCHQQWHGEIVWYTFEFDDPCRPLPVKCSAHRSNISAVRH